MMISELSIKRPVLALVLNVLIMITGFVAYRALPVREYPDVETPVVSITTAYTGASSETIESSVTQPLEEVLNGIDGIKSISSVSSTGFSTINIEFVPSRDIDLAATDVNNVVQSALGKIPQSADKPIISKTQANSQALMWISVQGDKYTPEELSDLADRVVKTPLQVLPGVGSIIIGGQRKYAMRVWLDPEKMVAHSVDASDIRNTILMSNLLLPAGKIEGETRKFNIYANAQIADPEIFSNLVIQNRNGILTRVKDVGGVELGSANYDTIVKYNGKPVIGIGIVKQSKANELKVAEEVKERLPRIRESLPRDVTLGIAVDNSRFVKESLKEVTKTIFIAVALVVLITFVFLRAFSPTFIIAMAIPPSIVGHFAGLRILGYSINVITLLALVLAVGLVVDDAIVVLENIFRHQEHGENKLDAAVKGSREIGFPVIATTISLIAIFIPLALFTGYTGRLFKEFAVSIALSVAISGFVALTLTPMMCSKYLNHTSGHGAVYYLLERFFAALNLRYEKALQWTLSHTRVILAFIFVVMIGIVVLFNTIPKTSIPVEDRGVFLTVIKSPEGSTLAYTNNTLFKVEKEVAKTPEVEGYFSAIGLAIGGPPNTSNGFVFSRLKHWHERTVKQQTIVQNLFSKLVGLPGSLVFVLNPPSLGQSSISKDVQFVIKGSKNNIDELAKVTSSILEKVRQMPGLINVDSDLLISTPQIDIVFDRDRAADLGVPVSEILNSFQTLFSESRINDFTFRNKQYDVIASLLPKYRSIPEQISSIYVHGRDNSMLPLSSFIKVIPKIAPAQINHYNLQRSITITASLAPGFPLGQALSDINKIAKEKLPPGYTTGLAGASREFAETSSEIYFTFAIAIIFIYFVLAALFESLIHPLTILFSVPLAVFGALFTLLITGDTLNLYSAIGIILLVGLVTKNAILIVEYTNQSRTNGLELFEAVVKGCKTRFRPILMTSSTMVLGALPLVFASGAGAESRHPMGLAIIGGLVFSTFFTLFVIPVVYIIFVKIAENFNISTVPLAKQSLILLTIMFLFANPLPMYSEENESSQKDILKLDDPALKIKLEARIDVPLELNLEKALNIAAMQNLDIAQAEYQKNVQKWRLWENLGNFLPNYKVGFSDQRFDGTFLVGGVFPVMSLTSSVNAFMRFDYPFFQGGKGFFNTLSAKNSYKSFKENLSASLNNTLLAVTQAYNQLLSEQAHLGVLEKAVEEGESILELNKNLESNGAGTKFDVLQSEAQLAEQQQQFIAQQAKLREASINLSRLLNLELGADIKPDQADLKTRELFNIDSPIAEIISIAKKNRPEVKKVYLEYLAQRNQIGVAFSEFLPQANFFGQYGGTGHVIFHRTKVSEVIPDAVVLDNNGNPMIQMVSRGRMLNQVIDSGIDLSNITSVSNVIRGGGRPFLARGDDSLMANKSIGIQVDWPIANGFGLPATSRINQARNQAKVLKTSWEILNQKVEQEVRTAYLKVQTAEKLIGVAKKRVAAATEALELAKARMENGVGINTELLNAQKQYKDSLASEVNATIEYNNAQAEFLHKLGLISIERLLGQNKS
ncbi:MAG: efflux RND transporter permease subunit [Candidatus Melainabacteria bacterium]|nr:efflux RND transporter permease subunit [Candidatus Melainabacteria bacterium]